MYCISVPVIQYICFWNPNSFSFIFHMGMVVVVVVRKVVVVVGHMVVVVVGHMALVALVRERLS